MKEITVMDKITEEMAEQEKHRWIPVEERPPKIGQTVIVTYKHTHGGGTSVTTDKWTGLKHVGWSLFGDMVVAWMPFPEPWKPKEEL